MKNKEPEVRLQSADLVSAVAPLLNEFGDNNTQIMNRLILFLYESLGEVYPEVLGSIIGALYACLESLNKEALSSLDNPSISMLLPTMTPILKNRHEKVQENCVKLIGLIACKSAECINAKEWMRICFDLLDMLKSQRKRIRIASNATFGFIANAIGPQDVLATLLNNLRVQERQLRVCTAVAIGIVADTCEPFTVLPALMNEYRMPDKNVQNGILKSLGFMFEYISGAQSKDYIHAVTPLIGNGLTDRDQVHRQTAATVVRHLALNCTGFANDDHIETFTHLMNLVLPNIYEQKVIQQRKERRRENQEDAAMSAQKILAIQLQKDKDLPHSRKRELLKNPDSSKTEVPNPDGTVYLEDMPILHPEHGASQEQNSQQAELVQSSPTRKFIKKDEYHLPEIRQFTVSKDDNRIMPADEFQEYTENADFDTVDGINIDSVDPSSKEFTELPLATQYMILSHLRLRSRLRLGYSKDQLEGLFPSSKDFSKFQIDQVKKRNFYTQRLMTVSGMSEDSGNITRRIAGDKDRHYALVKNEDGWTLSLGDGDGDLIEIDDNGEIKRSLMSSFDDDSGKNITQIKTEDSQAAQSSDSDEEFEDVPAHLQEDDEDSSQAIIQSIYGMYKNDYEESSSPNEIEGSQKMQNNLPIGTSEHKKDVVNQVTDLDENQPDLNSSMLFRSQNIESSDEKKQDADESATFRTSEPPEPSQSSHAMPSWFDHSVSQIERPHSGDRFFTQEAQSTRPMNEDKKVGLISYSEARDLIDIESIPGSPIEQEHSDVEIVNEQNVNDEILGSDVEIANEKSFPKYEHKNDDTRQTEFKPSMIQHEKKDSEKGDSQKDDGQESEALTHGGRTVRDRRQSTTLDSHGPTEQIPEKFAPQRPAVLDYELEEDEEAEMMNQLREEDNQHEEFAIEMKTKHHIPISSTSLISDEQLYQERVQKAKRDSDEVSQTMIQDVQELLKRFGIPFITAPMEAEAQCAELYRLQMVDGIITDDSDCFLFGGSRIYKNMFNQKQYVECYFNEEIDHKIGLDRIKLIELALLLGSDYTEGIKGIGPVLAMEILAEFEDLKSFKRWFDEHARGLSQPKDPDSKLKKNLLKRIKSGKLFLPDNFPDQVVFQAYTHPEVDRDTSEFKWGVPNLDQIRSFLMYNVGWSQSRVDEVMLPLIRDMNKKRSEGTQTTVGEFFPQEYISYKKDAALGKRMKSAATRLHKRKKLDK
ncbi:uncharacterized protein CXQ87_001295 [Candidozyma duobushaemuli]|uniref:XPG-I domain-containing protein n=1 Tax=Candidozyma duobushaemuli TaxID=1231522 RepID=A0A2V1AJX9_9ASCO|nr:uncharacterized protein CXQ87_001295 [[Candida] duobushaemulonis]PVH18370.1 hypothetical protein CXQ87_001295 [[Candida] duobushaemulonis]